MTRTTLREKTKEHKCKVQNVIVKQVAKKSICASGKAVDKQFENVSITMWSPQCMIRYDCGYLEYLRFLNHQYVHTVVGKIIIP